MRAFDIIRRVMTMDDGSILEPIPVPKPEPIPMVWSEDDQCYVIDPDYITNPDYRSR